MYLYLLMEKKTILIVDDTIPLLEELVSIFELEGYQVLAYDSALDALSTLENAYPDVIITDIVMPKMSGIEFIRTLRHQKKHSNIPIIVLTADNTVLKSDILDKFNVHAMLAKPCSVEKLLYVIEEAVND